LITLEKIREGKEYTRAGLRTYLDARNNIINRMLVLKEIDWVTDEGHSILEEEVRFNKPLIRLENDFKSRHSFVEFLDGMVGFSLTEFLYKFDRISI
jgi:hypothetical protein